MVIVNIIAAVARGSYGIGKDGGIPWHNKEDMRWFRTMTSGATVIMGRRTYESIGHALPNRKNVVISSSLKADDATVVGSVTEALEWAENNGGGMVYVIGGESIYRQFLKKDLVDAVYLDSISVEAGTDFDTFFPFGAMHGLSGVDPINGPCTSGWQRTFLDANEDASNTYYALFRRRTDVRNRADVQYNGLLADIISRGERKDTRAGATRSLFGKMLRFNMADGLPVLTTKKVFTKGCVHELLWFLKGDTNIRYLVENGVHIWDDDAYRSYLEKYGETLPKSKDEFLDGVLKGETIASDGYTYGDLGPVYGKQWRSWDGHDQIAELIDKLRRTPDDRRMIVSAWNVGDMDKMALPPCHFCSQWYTKELTREERIDLYLRESGLYIESASDEALDTWGVPRRSLSMMWSQRSVDTCLGLPYNILSYSILLHMVAHVVNMVPCEVICSLGDTHIYENQIENAKLQMVRDPMRFSLPTIRINEAVKEIDGFRYEDIMIEGYESYPSIKYELSVGLAKN